MTLHELVEKAKAEGFEYAEIRIFKEDPFDLAHGGKYIPLELDKVKFKTDYVWGDRVYIDA